jgi:hypothetical protein
MIAEVDGDYQPPARSTSKWQRNQTYAKILFITASLQNIARFLHDLDSIYNALLA